MRSESAPWNHIHFKENERRGVLFNRLYNIPKNIAAPNAAINNTAKTPAAATGPTLALAGGSLKLHSVLL